MSDEFNMQRLFLEIAALRDEVRALRQPATGEILTLAEARAYVKRPSRSAFNDWCRANGIKAAHRGRYSRTQLDLALQREARKRAA